MHRASRVPLFVVCLATAVVAQARSTKASVGIGPIVAVHTHDAMANGHVNVWSVADFDGMGAAQPFWRSANNCDVLARLDRHHLLLASYGAPYALVVVDLAAGSHTILADGAPHEFYGLHGDSVLHLGDGRVDTLDPFPYATPWAKPEARRRFAAIRCERIAAVAGNLAILIEQGERAVHSVSLHSSISRVLWTPPAGASRLTVALSPGGQRLAIGSVAQSGKGLLTVVDIATGAVVRQWPDLPIEVSPLSSNLPNLVVGWHDDEHVVGSETRSQSFVWVRRSLGDGAVVDEQAYASIGLWHDRPPEPAPQSVPRLPPVFRHEATAQEHLLWRVGEAKPLCRFAGKELPSDTLCFAPGGSAVVVCDRTKEGPALLFTASTKAPRTLCETPTYAVVWFGPAEAPSLGAPR